MPYSRWLALRLRSAFAASHRFSSLSAGILIAMCAGLLLPALIGGMMLSGLRQEQVNKEMDSHLDKTVVLLAKSLAAPVWNYNINGAETIVEASLLDPQVVRITITVNAPEQAIFVSMEQPERRLGKMRVKSDSLVLSGEVVGQVEVEIDDGLRQLEFQQDRRAYFFVLLGQFVLALVLILIAIRSWVLRPLAQLTAFSNRLASGDLDQSIGWMRSDEIGHLACQLDTMRSSLRTSFAEQQAILSNIQVGVIFVRERTIQLANRHAEQIFGYAQDEMRGLQTRIFFLSDEQYSAICDRSMAALSSGDGRYEEELRLQHRDGRAFWARMRGCALDSSNRDAGSIWVYEDISARKAAESEINSLAFYDSLTGLPNRRLLLERLKQSLAFVTRNETNGALLLIDLDNFKTLNDTLGHDIGDLLLQKIGERLTACIREGDTVARLGGDEFVVLLENLSGCITEAAAQAQLVGEKIMKVFSHPYRLGIYEHHCSASIGIALFDDQSKRACAIDEQLKKADLALYQAKGAGRNAMRFFDPEMQAVVMARAALEAGLREAVSKGQFLLFYQPQVNSERHVTGVEALLRWQHPTRGMVSPAEFIPLAEDTGLILPLGHWVLETACAQLVAWAGRSETAHLTIAINVSARQLHHRDFVPNVLAVLERTGANPRRLKLELTESLLVGDVEDTIIKMSALKEKGVCFSLDDFGTGYSSLSYLKRLPLEQLKIDQSFVRDILTEGNDASIARMVVVLAESLGLAVIAEGVETEAQKDFLAQQGCHAYQGYLFGRPAPIQVFEEAFFSAAKFRHTPALL